MEDNLERQRSKTWEEEMYWKHFNSMHFCHILPKDFHEHLVLPPKFAGNLIAEMPDKVSLFSPSGTVWNVVVKKSSNISFVGDGWKEFVKAYDLEVGYLLVFKYKRNVGFEVLMFDPISLCEKEAAYFVKKHELGKTDGHEKDKKRSPTEAFGAELSEDEEKDDNDSEFVVSKRIRKDVEDVVFVEERNNVQVSRKSSSVRVTRGGRGGRGRSRRVVYLKSAHNAKVKSGGGKRKSNVAAEDQHTPEIGGSIIEMNHSHESSEIRGNKQTENAAMEDQNNPDGGGSIVMTVLSQKSSEVRGKKPNGDQCAKEISQENRENTPETVESQKLYETRGMKPNADETAKEQNRTEIEGSTLVVVHCPESIEIGGEKPNEVETSKEQNSIGGVHSHNISANRRPKTRSPVKYCRKLVSGNGKRAVRQEAAKGQNSPEIGVSTLEMVHTPIFSETRSLPKKRTAPKSSRKMTYKSDSAKKRLSKEYSSNRREVTKSEIANALQRAEKKLNDKSFIAVMRPTGVYKRFYMNVPIEWMHKHLAHRHQEVILRVGEKTWMVMFYYYNSQKGGGLAGGGWKTFVLDNNLEEFDVCVFNLANQKSDPAAVFDVHIFRVVPEIVPRSPTQ